MIVAAIAEPALTVRPTIAFTRLPPIWPPPSVRSGRHAGMTAIGVMRSPGLPRGGGRNGATGDAIGATRPLARRAAHRPRASTLTAGSPVEAGVYTEAGVAVAPGDQRNGVAKRRPHDRIHLVAVVVADRRLQGLVLTNRPKQECAGLDAALAWERSRSSRTSPAPHLLPELSGAVSLGDERLLPTRLGSVDPRRRALAGVARLAGEQALVGADVASALDRRSRSGWTSASPFIRASGTGGPDACSRPEAGTRRPGS
jgi:hypothetical protein